MPLTAGLGPWETTMRSRRALPALALLAAFVLAAACGAPPAARAEILWDRYGVPHVFADDAPGLAYGLGWAEMRNHADLILRLYGEARGRAAEYWGEDYLDGDKWVRLMGVPERARAWDAALDPGERAIVDAFVDGVNDYAREHADAIGDELKPVLPVVPSDVLAHVQRVIHFSFVTSRAAVDAAAERLGAARVERLGRRPVAHRVGATPCCSPTRTCPGAASTAGSRRS